MAKVYLSVLFSFFLLSQAHALENGSRSFTITPKTPKLTLIFSKDLPLDNIFLQAPDEPQQALQELNNGFLATQTHEVIQIKAPKPGTWLLKGDKERIKKISILNRIGIKTAFNSGPYFNHELLSLQLTLTAENQPISAEAAYEQIRAKLILYGKYKKYYFELPYAGKGVFINSFILTLPPDHYEGVFKISGTYLEKAQNISLDVLENPFAQHVNSVLDQLMLELTRPELIKPESIKVEVLVDDVPKKLLIKPHELSWIIDFVPLCLSKNFNQDNALILVKAQMHQARAVIFKLFIEKTVCSPYYQPPPPPPVATPVTVKKPSMLSLINYWIILACALFLALGSMILLLFLRRRKNKNQLKDEMEVTCEPIRPRKKK